MAGYKEIKGFQVQTRSEDPTPYAQALADNPYAGTWASGGALNTARYGLGGFGANTSAHIATGGHKASSPNRYDLTEQYNGSSWTEVGDLNTAREYLSSAGASSTAGIVFSGYEAPPPSLVSQKTESWDGSSWTEVGDLNDQRYLIGGFGTQTSAIGATGYDGTTNVRMLNHGMVVVGQK